MICDLCLFKQCVCQKFWKTFDEDFKQTIDSKIGVSSLNISTITLNFKIKFIKINLGEIEKQFKKSLFTHSIEYIKGARKSRKDPLINYQMYNSAKLISYLEREDSKDEVVKVVTKIFHNGSFNVTGLRSMKQIILYLHKMLEFLKSFDNVIKKETIIEFYNVQNVRYKILKKDTLSPIKKAEKIRLFLQDIELPISKNFEIHKIKYIEIDNVLHEKMETLQFNYDSYNIGQLSGLAFHDVKISMINTDFTINRKIRQKKFSNYLQEEDFQYENGGNIKLCEFNLDKKYHAVKIKYVHRKIKENAYYTRKRIAKLEGEVTIAIFNTGSIIITGGKNPEEFISAYRFIIDIMEKNEETFLKPLDSERKLKKRKTYLKKLVQKNL